MQAGSMRAPVMLGRWIVWAPSLTKRGHGLLDAAGHLAGDEGRVKRHVK